jgi:hypothetical protein
MKFILCRRCFTLKNPGTRYVKSLRKRIRQKIRKISAPHLLHLCTYICILCTYRGLVLGEVEFLVEVDGEDCLHPVVGEPLTELVPNDEKHALRVGQRLKNKALLKGQ